MKTLKKKPSISIVGAGPGDPELLTIKALRAIESADVILYDALVNKQILDYARAGCKKIFVGKRKCLHMFNQHEINELLVKEALNCGKVVRLKGGDPFVFGRGGEEMLHISKRRIPFEIIPGISSAVAVPGRIGIPVTHRSLSESFWVITATTSERQLSNDIKVALQSSATLVILMGLGKLQKIVDIFLAENKQQLPVAVIQNGTCANQKYVIGQIDSIVKKTKEAKISTPAIIIIGEVVNIHEEIHENLFEEEYLNDEFIYQNLNLLGLTA